MSNMKILGEGSNAIAYLKDGKTLKKYFKNIDIQDRLDKDMFEFLKSVDDIHFMKLKNYKLCKLIDFEMDRQVDGIKEYTYEYVKKYETKKIIDLEDYLMTNFKELENLAETLASYGVMMYDTASQNSIITKDNIVIIDPDYFVFCTDRERTFRHNKIEILNLFIDLISENYHVNYNEKYLLYTDALNNVTENLYKQMKLLKVKRK